MRTCRRYYLDRMLSQFEFYGDVIDIGGKKNNKRGKFVPPLKKVKSWKYVNIDETTHPDYLCSGDAICVENDSFDIAIITEVLEHIENPSDFIKEAKRVLKPEGIVLITMPLLYPVYDDPDDLQRWTYKKLELELISNGFEINVVKPMGSTFAVIFDLLHVSIGKASKNKGALKNRIISKYIFPFFSRICLLLDKKYYYKSQWITTGYFLVGKNIKKGFLNDGQDTYSF